MIGSDAKRRHVSSGHKVSVVNELREMQNLGIVRKADDSSSSTNKQQPLNIAGVRKKVVYIGKSGKEIATRREGSRVAVKYEYAPMRAGMAAEISEQDYYKMLFANGMPSPEVLHTFSSHQSGATHFARALLKTKSEFAIVTKSSDDGRLIFARVQDRFHRCENGKELSDPERCFLGSTWSRWNSNGSGEERAHIADARYLRETMYYDVLAPRADWSGAENLTRVLISTYYSDEAVREGKTPESRRFILYELDSRELASLKSGTSFDWATRIVQDAEEIMCS